MAPRAAGARAPRRVGPPGRRPDLGRRRDRQRCQWFGGRRPARPARAGRPDGRGGFPALSRPRQPGAGRHVPHRPGP
ncbi:hypothetical protein E4N63_04600 [Streptomyces sp. MNU89]|nr:hypothetical protein [Streptomyces sp. MNU89]